MRIVLATICLLAFAVFVFTFVGQSAAFYRWHDGSMEVRRYYPADKEAAQDFERRIWQGHPRWQEWAVIRGLSGGLLLAALAGFWIERRRKIST